VKVLYIKSMFPQRSGDHQGICKRLDAKVRNIQQLQIIKSTFPEYQWFLPSWHPIQTAFPLDFLERKVRENLGDLGPGKKFLVLTPKVWLIQEKLEINWTSPKKNLKMFCSVKDLVKRIKRQATDWEKIYACHLSTKGIYESQHSAVKKQTI
jgi:hypothetical protein